MSSARLFQQPVDAGAMRHLDDAVGERLRAVATPAAPAQSLRRTGRRPYAFNGTLLATVCGVERALPFWYEINVYQTVLETFVCDVRLFNKADVPDLFRVTEHDDLEAAFAHLEAYDASADLVPADDLADSGGSSAELALRVARLQMRVNAARQHYDTVVADLLEALQPQLG